MAVRCDYRFIFVAYIVMAVRCDYRFIVVAYIVMAVRCDYRFVTADCCEAIIYISVASLIIIK